MPSVEANGVSLAFFEEGSGAPVIFVHESLNDMRTWRIQVPDFGSNGYRAIAYSRRNHHPNLWSGYPRDYSVATEAQDLRAFIESLKINKEPVHLVGSSYGAFACAVLARDSPEVVRSLVLGEPPILSLISSSHSVYFDRAVFEARQESEVVPLLDAGKIEEGVGRFVDSINGDGAYDGMTRETRQRMLENGRTLRYELTSSKRDPFTKDDASRISPPTLLLRSEHSPVMFQIITQELLRSLPKARVETIKHSSHLMHLHNPKDYDETVLRFLRET